MSIIVGGYDYVSWCLLDRKGRCSAFVYCDGYVVGAAADDCGGCTVQSNITVWDVNSSKEVGQYRLPFAIISLTSPSCGGNPGTRNGAVVLITTARYSKLFLLDIASGVLQELRILASDCGWQAGLGQQWSLQPTSGAGVGKKGTNAASAEACYGDTYDCLCEYWRDKVTADEQQDSAGNHEGHYGFRGLSSACLVIPCEQHELDGTATNLPTGLRSVLYVVVHDQAHPQCAAALVEVGIVPPQSGQTVQYRCQRSAALDLPRRVQGLGLRDQLLYAITEDRRIIVLDRSMPQLQRVRDIQLGPSDPLPRCVDHRNAAVFLIHKPVGCVSSTVATSENTLSAGGDGPSDHQTGTDTDGTLTGGTVYDWAGKAGFPTNLGLVGRLDADTSGIMVFTNDGRLNERLVHPGAPDGAGGAVDGDGYKSKEYVLTLLQGRNRYCLEDDGTFDTARFEEEFGRPLEFSRFNCTKAVREAQIRVRRRYQDPRFNPHNRPDLGWVTEVLVTIREGKHQQIRRLARRAGYHVVSLCRVSLCGGLLRLDSVPAPGQCHWLSAEEKRALYEAVGLLTPRSG